MKIALKLDIDTHRGYLEGLPRLLDLFDERGVRASIFFSMGPDNSGKAIRRVFRRGFISKMFRTKATSAYGVRTMLYGTLLPAPMIVESDPSLLKRAYDAGHDCGVHAWDHVLWQDELPKLSRETIKIELERAFSLFERITSARPACFAAPGWQTTPDALAVLDELSLEYASDTRGEGPFYPEGNATLQLPTTLPTMDEILGTDGAGYTDVADLWFGAMRGRPCDVLTIHTEMEGGAGIGALGDFLRFASERGAEFVTLRDLARSAREAGAPVCAVVMREIPGRSGVVATQFPQRGKGKAS